MESKKNQGHQSSKGSDKIKNFDYQEFIPEAIKGLSKFKHTTGFWIHKNRKTKLFTFGQRTFNYHQ